MYTPYLADQNGSIANAKVGCNVVAAAQIIYAFRKNNPRDNVEVPYYAEPTMGQTLFSTEKSKTMWSEMAETMQNTGTDKTSLFLAFLGHEIMDVDYGLNSTGVDLADLDTAFYWAKIEKTVSSTYSLPIIMAYLNLGSPILMHSYVGRTQQNGVNNVHYYLIDRYRINSNRVVMNMRWNESYKVSAEEYFSNPPEMFQPNGEDEMQLVISEYEGTLLGMKWGASNAANDDVFYLARTQTSGTTDDTGYVPPTDIIYDPYWSSPLGTLGSVRNMIYDFREMR